VQDDPDAPFGTRVLPGYEVQSEIYIEADLNDLKKRHKNHPRMEIHQDYIKEDLGRVYGIHSYCIIKSKEE